MMQWFIAHGYLLMFLAMCAEGPMATVAAAFAAALGYFDPFAVLALSILGDLVPDAVLYVIGYWGRLSIVRPLGHWVGLTEQRLVTIDAFFQRHPTKAVVAAKFTPGISMVLHIVIGALRLPFREYMIVCVSIALPKSALLVFLGYEFGWAYDSIGRFLQTDSLIAAAVVTAVVCFIVLRMVSRRISRSVAVTGIH